MSAAITSVTAVALLFAVFDSTSVAVTVARFVTVPDVALTVTIRVTVVLAPAANVPNAHVTVPDRWVQLELAERKVIPTGSVSTNVTLLAGAVPALAIPSVYVRVVPATTGSGASTFVT